MAKILLADDSSFMRKVLIDMLSKNGFDNILEAENGKQAIEKFTTESPDLVLLDIIMPELDGIAVLKEIVPKGAKALVISAVGQDDIVEQANAAGAKGYIIKPFEESQVITEVNKILSSTTNTAPTTAQAPLPTPASVTTPVLEQQAPTTPVSVEPVQTPIVAPEIPVMPPTPGGQTTPVVSENTTTQQ